MIYKTIWNSKIYFNQNLEKTLGFQKYSTLEKSAEI